MEAPTCSVIVPVLNCADYLEQCLRSVLEQDDVSLKTVEVILCDDASVDESFQVARRLASEMEPALNRYVVLSSDQPAPTGCGSARNRCCEVARSDIFVFLDADDMMRPKRLYRSLAMLRHFGLVGGNFDRLPAGSTPRYEQFHRSITTDDIRSLKYAFRDAPLAMPTVSCTREVWTSVGGFVEGSGVPEDLHFQYAAIERSFTMGKLDGDSVVGYRYHERMTSLTLTRKLLMGIRVAAFERIVLSRPQWRDGFSIWGAGRDGKEFYRALSESARRLVLRWGDIDPKKIGTKLREKAVVHYSELTPPMAICVTLARDGELEKNLANTSFIGGTDYFHIS